MNVGYEIDAGDRLVGYDQGWIDFALDNDAPGLTAAPPQPVIWGSIVDDTTRQLWQAIVSHVRVTGTPLDIRYRCDAPHARRWFVTRITPLSDGRVKFDAELLREELREPVIDERIEVDTDRFIQMCSWCARFECGDSWCEVEEAAARARWLEQRRQPTITHTICPSCLEAQLAQLDAP